MRLPYLPRRWRPGSRPGRFKPIEQLTGAVHDVASGHLERMVSISSRNEIGDLAADFNRMTAQLREMYETMEERVRSADGWNSALARDQAEEASRTKSASSREHEPRTENADECHYRLQRDPHRGGCGNRGQTAYIPDLEKS